MLKGRLGIDSAKIPHGDRAGLLYLARGTLTARFPAEGNDGGRRARSRRLHSKSSRSSCSALASPSATTRCGCSPIRASRRGRRRRLGRGDSAIGLHPEDPGQSFVLDVADLYRDTVTVPRAFHAAKRAAEQPGENVERLARHMTGRALIRERIVSAMIERIKTLFAETIEEG